MRDVHIEKDGNEIGMSRDFPNKKNDLESIVLNNVQ